MEGGEGTGDNGRRRGEERRKEETRWRACLRRERRWGGGHNQVRGIGDSIGVGPWLPEVLDWPSARSKRSKPKSACRAVRFSMSCECQDPSSHIAPQHPLMMGEKGRSLSPGDLFKHKLLQPASCLGERPRAGGPWGTGRPTARAAFVQSV